MMSGIKVEHFDDIDYYLNLSVDWNRPKRVFFQRLFKYSIQYSRKYKISIWDSRLHASLVKILGRLRELLFFKTNQC